jgi:hypothetical protein
MAKTIKRKHIKKMKKDKRTRKYKKRNNKTYNNKTYNNNTYRGSGKFDKTPTKHTGTPYSKPMCKYGSECTRKNPAHFAEFSHPSPCRDGIHCTNMSDEHFTRFTHPPYTRYENDDQIKHFIQDCYDSYSRDPSNMFAHFQHSSISFLQKGIYDSRTLRQTFFFNLLAYITCNICDIIAMPNGRVFITTMLQRFNEEAIDGNFIIKDDEPELKMCIQRLGIPFINCIAIVSVLNDPESEFNKNGCL